MPIREIYKELGLTDKQALIYNLLLSQGGQSVARIAKATSIPRGVAFYIIKELIKKGLVEKTTDHHGRPLYISTHPENLLKNFESRIEHLEKGRLQLEAELPSLISNYALSTSRPGVVFIDNPRHFKRIYNDILTNSTSYKEIFPSNEIDNQIKVEAEAENFIAQRRKSNIKFKMIYKTTDKRLRNYFEPVEKNMEARFIAEDTFSIPSDILIYNTKVVLVSFNPLFFATVVDNKDINQTFNQIFDYIWEATKTYHDQVIANYLNEHPDLKKVN